MLIKHISVAKILLRREILNVAQWGEKTNPHGVAYYLLFRNFGDWRINRLSPAKNILLIPIRIAFSSSRRTCRSIIYLESSSEQVC